MSSTNLLDAFYRARAYVADAQTLLQVDQIPDRPTPEDVAALATLLDVIDGTAQPPAADGTTSDLTGHIEPVANPRGNQ